jgi:hypothetical protein
MTCSTTTKSKQKVRKKEIYTYCSTQQIRRRREGLRPEQATRESEVSSFSFFSFFTFLEGDGKRGRFWGEKMLSLLYDL